MILNKLRKTGDYIKHILEGIMKLEINYKKKTRKNTNVETEQHVIEQSMDQWRNQRGNKKKYFETNENTTFQNLYAGKAVLW